MVFSHLKMLNSFTTIYYVLFRINTYPVRARASLRVAVGRLRTTPLLHICASLRSGQARTWNRRWQKTPSRRLDWGGKGGNCWVCWPDTFWLGRWLLTSQPPPGTSPPALSGSYESNLNAADRPHRGGPQAVVSESHPSGEPEWSTNLASVATSQLASSIQFQVFVCLSFTGKFKFVSVASRPESLRLRHVVSSSLSPLDKAFVPSRFVHRSDVTISH